MSDDGRLPAGDPALRNLGLIADPFAPPPGVDVLPLREVVHAGALRFMAALDAAADDPRSTPVWVTKSPAVPGYYSLAALAETLNVLASSPELNVLAAFIPLDMMYIGRIRSALSALAENLGNRSFDRTLAAWVRAALAEIDPALPEAALLDAAAVERLRERLAEEPVETIALYFGPCVGERDEGESLEQMMRVAGARQSGLEEEPAEDQAAAEEVAEDQMAEVFTMPIGDAEKAAIEPAEGGEAPSGQDEIAAQGLPSADDLVDYVAAYAKEHLSPVVARGIRVYRAQGTSAMTQELKITKAPKKTLAALAKFASHRYRKVVLVYDRFDNWNEMPDDNKPAIIGALSELRWALGENGVIALLVADGQAPELAEQFAGARKMAWDFATLPAMEQEPPRLDVEVVGEWLDSARVDGAGRAIDEGRMLMLIDAAAGDVESFLGMASAAVQGAAARGLDAVDDTAIEAASQRE